MSHADFWRIVVVAELFVVVDNLMSTRVVLRLLRPATEWLRGRRDPDTTVAAWRALAGLPMDYMRAHWRSPVIVTVIPVCIFITALLGKPWYTVFSLIGGGLVTLAYGLILRFLAIELAMRPVIEDVSMSLPDGANLGTVTIPLRWKLLAGLPIINIITGVVVSGLSKNGTHQLSDLGLDVVVAVIVAFTISLELTLLLAKSILEPLENLRDATRRVGRGDLSARVPVTSTDETGSLSRAFNNAVAGLQERQQLREAFGAFVDPDLAERVLSEGHVLEGEDVEVTVLFLDIRGFTAFAERSSAREVVTRLNDFYDLVVPILLKHGGHANKFVGDGLLGVFGAPDRRPDHADRAVAAALDIAGKVRERYGDLYIGIGVNSGPVGGDDRRRRARRVHGDRRPGEHGGAGRGGHARDGRRDPHHRGDALPAHPRALRARGATARGAQGQDRARAGLGGPRQPRPRRRRRALGHRRPRLLTGAGPRAPLA